MRRGLTIGAVGSVLGVFGALLANRLLVTLLYDVTPTDLATLTAVTGLLVGVATLASLIPAQSSARDDPMVALRYEEGLVVRGSGVLRLLPSRAPAPARHRPSPAPRTRSPS